MAFDLGLRDIKNMSEEEIDKLVNDLTQLDKIGLLDKEIKIENPLWSMTPEDMEDPELYFFRFMRNPDFFYFTCKHLFGITLFPYQCVILRELWNRPFPMLIGTRGMGKSLLLGLHCLLRCVFIQGRKVVVTGAGFRQAKQIFNYMEKQWNVSPVLRSLFENSPGVGPHHGTDMWTFNLGESVAYFIPIGDGCVSSSTLTTYGDGIGTITRHSTDNQVTKINSEVWGNGKFSLTDEAYNNGIKPTKIITTHMGFSYEGTFNHGMKVLRDGAIDFARTDDMKIGDHILIDRSVRWHGGKTDIAENEAYAAGLLVGDGCYTNKYKIGFATKDQEFIPTLNKLFEPTGKSFKWAGPNDPQHFTLLGKDANQWFLDKFGIDGLYGNEKSVPENILKSEIGVMSAFIAGLMDADGCVFVNTAKGGTSVSVSLTTTSKKMANQLMYIFLHYGIVAHLSKRERNEKWNTVYELLISGPDVYIYKEKIGFRLNRKKVALELGLLQKKRNATNGDGIPGVKDLMLEIFAAHKLKRNSGSSQLRISKTQISKRKVITFDYAEKFLSLYSHVDDPRINQLRSLVNRDYYYDEISSIESGECHTYDIHVPDGHEYCANGFFSHNSKIRGLRANDVISDEYASMSKEIYDSVVSGFGVVAQNPEEKVEAESRMKVMKMLGIWNEAMTENRRKRLTNQNVISGTAYYQFNHFYPEFLRYRAIIESRGDQDYIKDKTGKKLEDGLDWRDYSIIRIPVGQLPTGYMDQKTISRLAMSTTEATFLNEIEACFVSDTNGFFKMSMLNACTTENPVQVGESDEYVQFHALTEGDPNKEYVFGIDPASEQDMFSIVIVELNQTHRRIVYCWTTNNKVYKKNVENGLEKGGLDYYGYCVRKIRNLMKVFKCVHIALDSQGGGVAIRNGLADKKLMEEGELPIYLLKSNHPLANGKSDENENKPGLHILEMVSFASAAWTSEANHGMRFAFEKRMLLFPKVDTAYIAMRFEMDNLKALADQTPKLETLEVCYQEIEKLKEELSTIEMRPTPMGTREKWDTPEENIQGKKGRQHKDRYCSLLMADASARVISGTPQKIEYRPMGGFVGTIKGKSDESGDIQPMYQGPDWFTSKANDRSFYGCAIVH